MNLSASERYILLVGTLLCAGLLFLAAFDVRALTGWRLPAVFVGCVAGIVMIALDLRKGGAK